MPTYVVNTGIAVLTNRLKNGASQPEPVYSAWGTAVTPNTQRTDTGLSTETANSTGSRVAGTSSVQTSNPGTSPNNDTYQVVATLTVGSGTGAINVTNAGLFDAASGGNLYLKGDFPSVSLNVGDSIQFTFKTVFASS